MESARYCKNWTPIRHVTVLFSNRTNTMVGLTPVSWRDESLGSGSLALRHVILGFLAFFGSAPGGALLPSRPVH